MSKRAIPALVLGLMLLAAPPQSSAQEMQKLAQTGMKFLSLSGDPRAAALGDAVTAMDGFATSFFYNPAGVAWQQHNGSVFAAQTNWIADIHHNHIAATFSPFQGRWGVIGLTLQNVDYGEMIGTVRAENEAGFVETGLIRPTALAVGAGYARALTDRFAVGGHVKFVTQDLASSALRIDQEGEFEWQDNRASVVAFDFGVLYHTGFRSLKLAMSARNFSQQITFDQEYFELPLLFRMGLSMDMTDLTAIDPSLHSVVLSVDAERPRDYSEMLRFGLEYTFLRTLMLRAGYGLPIEGDVRQGQQQGASLGAGVRQAIGGVTFGADYAFTEFGVFGEATRFDTGSGHVHRLALQVQF
jgi:hypothetical protein